MEESEGRESKEDEALESESEEVGRAGARGKLAPVGGGRE